MLSLYCGVPGSGKSSLAAWFARRVLKRKGRFKRYRHVWSNCPIVGAYEIKNEDVGKVSLEDGLLLIDEAGIAFGNRDFKNFPKYQLEWFKLHRHYNVDVMLFSQSWDDTDKKIRELANAVYIVGKIPLLPLVYTKQVRVKIGVDEVTHDLKDLHYLVSVLLGGFRFYWVRSAWKLFDSYDAPALPAVDLPKWSRRAVNE